MPRILIIEDDPTINHMIAEFLGDKGCQCVQAFSGTEGRLVFSVEKFDIILMDLMLPGMTGECLTREIREKSQVPILILSAKAALKNKVNLLGFGADDYLTKPFELEELWARVQVWLRRSGIKSADGEQLYFKDWTVDLAGRTLLVKGTPIELTPHEFGIVELLVRYPKKVFTKQEIFESVWNQEYFVEDKTINVHISNIRSKLKATGTQNYIQTVWGIGFKMAAS